jgi:hypothetical protein
VPVLRTRIALLALTFGLIGSVLTPVLPGPAAAGPTLDSGRALPLLPEGFRPGGVALAGSWVYAGVRPYPGPSTDPMTIYRTAADGTGSWTTVTDPDTGQPLSVATMPSVVDGRMLVSGPQDDTTNCADYRVLAATVRKLASCVAPRLLTGGRVITAVTSSGPWYLEDESGAQVRSFIRPPALDGDRYYVLTAGLRVDVSDLASDQYIRTYTAPGNCQPTGPISATGGYLLIPCTGGISAIFDTTQTMPPWPLGNSLWFLGNGFAARPLAVSGGTEINVVDLGQGKVERSFLAQSLLRLAIDADGLPQLAFITPDYQVAMGDLGPLAARNTGPEDVTPPTVSLDTKPASLIKAASSEQFARLDYAWSGSDPSHPGTVRFDTRESEAFAGDPAVYQDAFHATTLTTVFASVPTAFAKTHCFQVRARDWAGNVSDWTTPVCSLVDAYPPWVEWTMAQWQGYLPALASTPVRLSWRGTDDGGLATSRLSVRIAKPGSAGTTWQIPSGWNALTTKSVSRTFQAGSRVCFRVQMRDRVGNISRSADAGTRCLAIPYDDRSFSSSGPVHRGKSSLMLGQTYTRLEGNHSWLVRKGVRIRAIYLRISSDYTVVPQIWLGSRRLDHATWNEGAGGHRRWVSFYFGTSQEGTLRIRGSSLGPISIDAIAVEH